MKLDKFFTKFWIIITICCFILIGISLFVEAVEAGDKRIGLEWEANTEINLAGYNIYVSYDTGGPYELIDTVGKNTTEFWWYGIFPGYDHYFVITAFNDEAVESDHSNEVCGYIDSDKDYGIECGAVYPEDDDGSSSGGCFINSL